MKKAVQKVDIVTKLREKIAEAKKHNDALAIQLQKLLDGILRDTAEHKAA